MAKATGRPLYAFEVDIARRLAAGGKMLASPKGEWIRGYLLAFGEGCPYEMWKDYSEFADRIAIRPGTYLSFARYMWMLKRLGLITLVRREKGPRGFPKSYYAIAPGMKDSPLWARPTQALYPSTDWTIKTAEEKYRLRAKYRK